MPQFTLMSPTTFVYYNTNVKTVKEDGTFLMATTQLILAWVLLGILLIWMATFTILAIRPYPGKQVTLEDVPTPSQPLPAISAPALLQVIASPPVQQRVGAVSSESAGDLGARSVS